MSASCCGQDAQFDGVSAAFKRALWIVIAINGAMFIVEMAAGAFAGSKALQADALDFLGDTTTYAISLYVIGMALHVRATAALIKGLSLAAMGLWVFGSTAYQVLVLGVPSATVMGGVGLLALLANLASVVLLMRFTFHPHTKRPSARKASCHNATKLRLPGYVSAGQTPSPKSFGVGGRCRR